MTSNDVNQEVTTFFSLGSCTILSISTVRTKLNTKQNNNKNQSLVLPSKVILTKPPHLRFTLTTLGKKN